MKNIILIDTFGFLFRAFFALPQLHSPDKKPTGVLMGFANLILQLHKDYKKQPLVFALESQEANLRKTIDSNYKATRPDIAPALAEQIPIAISWIEQMQLTSVNVAGFEADDVIASLANQAKQKGYQATIITHDKDFNQLISDNVRIYSPITKAYITSQSCMDKYGVTPEQFVDYQSIVGDSSDNIKGVKGIGAKGASELLQKFGSLDEIYNNLDLLKPRTAQLLKDGKDDAYRSQKLVRLHQDLNITLDFEQAVLPERCPLLHILPELKSLDFKRIVGKLAKHAPQNHAIPTNQPSTFTRKTEMINHIDTLMDVLNKLNPNDFIAFDTETNSLDSKTAKIIGFSFALDSQKGYYVPLAHHYLNVEPQIAFSDAQKAITKIFQHPIIGHNLKYDLEVIAHNFNIFAPLHQLHDTMILAWLLNSNQSLGLDWLAKKWLNHTMIAFNDIVSKKQTFADIALDIATEYAAEDAQATFALFEALKQAIAQQQPDLFNIATTLEFPFIRVLQTLEENGICIDVDFFQSLKKPTQTHILALKDEIYSHAQCSFNINSPLQLGEILFERLHLPCKKRTKNGYSTDESVLLSLKDSHPIIAPLLQYREVFKLQSTYIDPLLELAKTQQSPRIHSSFLQTGTATGRLSSRNPNLQNIPVRTDLGKQIRHGFIADDGFVLLSLDYSQIELRLLAHFSQDSTLMQAFEQGEDIHYKTAQKIFGSDAKQKRSIAKSINFGLIYGMGAKKLSETLGISLSDSKTYIKSYFDSFPTVKTFLKNTEEEILQNGYSQTLLGRRRHFVFTDIAPQIKAGYLREAINSIFQGSAADLIKLAMLAIYQQPYQPSELRMLLQIHDELIFEVRKDLVDTIAHDIANIMQHIYPLNVPLLCGISKGKNWGELK